MILAIFILSILIVFSDFIDTTEGKSSNLLFSTPINIISAWILNPTLGVIFLCVESILLLIALYGHQKNKR